ncbi:hypothetical protein CDL62_14490 [Alkalitalea saponilacus]|nr:hypothetical protein CDL62_14490 [Alkalitalea saponilacus]
MLKPIIWWDNIEGINGDKKCFDELFERTREFRASERSFYQKLQTSTHFRLVMITQSNIKEHKD